MAFCSIHGEDTGVLIFILSAYDVLSLNKAMMPKKGILFCHNQITEETLKFH